MQCSRSTFLRLSAASVGAGLATALGACSAPQSQVKTTLAMTWWGAAARAAVTQRVIGMYELQNPGVTIKGESSDRAHYEETLAKALAAPTPPDIVQLDDLTFDEYASRGLLADLSAHGVDLPLGDFDSELLATLQRGGRQLAVPSGVTAPGIIANVKLFRDAGVEIPTGSRWNWAIYRDLARRMQEVTPEGVYGAAANGYVEHWANQRDGGLFSVLGVGATNATVLEALEFEQSLISLEAGPSAEVAASQVGLSPSQALFAQNKLALQPGWSHELVTYSALTGGEYVMLPLPRQDDGSGGSGVYLKPVMAWAITQSSRDAAAAARFVAFVLNDSEAPALATTDRGVPPNAKVREAMRSVFQGVDLASLNYVRLVQSMLMRPVIQVPRGATATTAALQSASQGVLSGTVAPAAAAGQLLQALSVTWSDAQVA